MPSVSVDNVYAPPAGEAAGVQLPASAHVVSGEVELSVEDLSAGLREMPALQGRRLFGAVCLTGIVVGLFAQSLWMTVISLLLTFFLLFILHPGRLAKRQLAKMSSGERQLTWVFDAQSMRVASEGSELRLDYERLRRVQETSTTFLLFVEAHQAQIVPKRAFDRGDVDAIRQLLTNAKVNHAQSAKTAKRLLLWVAVVVLLLAAWLLLAPPA